MTGPDTERALKLTEKSMSVSNALTQLLSRGLGLRLIENVSAGYLMAESVRQGLHTYDMITLTRR